MLNRRINNISARKMWAISLSIFGAWLICYAAWIAWQVHWMHAAARALTILHR